jgi:cobalt/nickel transport system permease protein
LAVPFSTFLLTMLGVHLLVGLVEGLITVAVLGYLQQVRPDIVLDSLPGKARLSKKAVLATLLVFTVIIGAGLSLLACSLPDGLEWSYAERPDQPDFKSAVENKDPRIVAVDDFQSKYSPLPDYSIRTSKLGVSPNQQTEVAVGWTSFAGVLGSALTMAFIWLTAKILRKKESA